MSAKRKSDKAAQSTLGSLWSFIKTIVFAVLIALVVRTFLYEPFSIPSGSMYPGLLIGDYLFVSKYSYGYSRYSYPFSPSLHDGRILAGQPKRGDVVVFRLPTNTKIDYIKRVIGLPGDRIQVKDNVVQINGVPVKRREIGRWVQSIYLHTDTGALYRDPQGNPIRRTIIRSRFIETLPNGASYPTLANPESPSEMRTTRVYTVPKGHYFMMGDNRDNSIDSRFSSVGFVPAENLIGRAEFLFFSSNGTAALWQVWKWPDAIRFGRIFMGVR